VRRVGMEIPVAQVARACEVNPNVLRRWRREGRQFGRREFSGPGRSRAEEQRTAALERKVGQQALEIMHTLAAVSATSTLAGSRMLRRAYSLNGSQYAAIRFSQQPSQLLASTLTVVARLFRATQVPMTPCARRPEGIW